MNQKKIIDKPTLVYVIGPRFCVYSLAHESLKLLSEKYNVVCISEGPHIADEAFEHKPIRFVRVPSVFSDVVSLFQVLFIFINLKSIDKIVISTPKASFLTAIVCKIARKSYIYLHRGAVYQNYSGLKLDVFKRIDLFIIRNSSKTTYISKSLQTWVCAALGIEGVNYTRTFNSSKGVDLDKFRPRSRKHHLDKVIIGYCGRISTDKGFSSLKEVMHKYSGNKEIRIIIKGSNELNGTDTLQLEHYLASNNIEYLEWSDDVSGFFDQIDVLFFPSKREGFGNVAIEAAASGVPTIAFDIPGIFDAVSDGNSGILCKPGGDIVALLDQLISDKEKLAEMSLNSRVVAKRLFDQEMVLRDIHMDMNL
jgi:glycosyltransferase involved in cell wall biosynthesis